MQSTCVRVDRETHEEVKRLAKDLGTTMGEAVSIAARRLRQQRIGKDLSTPLRSDEVRWLNADVECVIDLDLGMPAAERPDSVTR